MTDYTAYLLFDEIKKRAMYDKNDLPATVDTVGTQIHLVATMVIENNTEMPNGKAFLIH